jgi:hypothetical protein
MAITQADVEQMVVSARQRVQGNWRPPGSNLNVLIAGDVRPLTTGALDMYLGFYSWLWEREAPPDEREEVEARLRNVPIAADWALRDAVLAVCALRAQIQELAPEDQEAIRSYLREGVEPGRYPELETESHAVTAGSLEEAARLSAARHASVMDALRNWPGLPG